MRDVAKLNEKDRKALFHNTAAKMGMTDAIIEKDFWVCYMLDYLFHRCVWKEHIAFKGGTSLSKSYGLIERFSEDIDLILDWRVLGYGIYEPWEERSNTKQDAFNKEAGARTEAFLRNEFMPTITADLQKELPSPVQCYRRCTWIRNGTKRIVWRCISRLEYGTKYCPDSPTIEEPALQKAILTALNTAMSGKEILIQTITDAMMQELVPIHGEQMSLSAINARLAELESEFGQLLPLASECGSDAYKERFQEILAEMTALKEKRAWLENQLKSSKEASQKIDAARQIMEQSSADLTEWDETTVRQLVETVKVLSAGEIEVHIKGGVRIRQKNV